MSRMFHRVLATSVIGAAALAAPLTAMAADVGCGTGTGGGTGAETPTAIVVHLPKHVEADEPVTVTARITPQQAAKAPSGAQPGKDKDGKGEGKDQKGKHKDKSGQGDDQQEGKDGAKGDEPGKQGKGGHHGHKGAGHGKKGKKHHKKGAGEARRHAVTGEVEFFLDGKPEPPVEVSRDQASEKIEIPLGRHTIYAEYSGDGDFEPAKSAPVTFELTNDQDGQGAQSGQDQDGRVGTSTETGLEDPSMGQTDPNGGRDSGDLTPGEQDQSDWGQDADDQDGPQDQA